MIWIYIYINIFLTLLIWNKTFAASDNELIFILLFFYIYLLIVLLFIYTQIVALILLLMKVLPLILLLFIDVLPYQVLFFKIDNFFFIRIPAIRRLFLILRWIIWIFAKFIKLFVSASRMVTFEIGLVFIFLFKLGIIVLSRQSVLGKIIKALLLLKGNWMS